MPDKSERQWIQSESCGEEGEKEKEKNSIIPWLSFRAVLGVSFYYLALSSG